jgi:hypothetical protein
MINRDDIEYYWYSLLDNKPFVFISIGVVIVLLLFAIPVYAMVNSKPVTNTVTQPPIKSLPEASGLAVYSKDNSTLYKANTSSLDIIRTKDYARIWNIPISNNSITSLNLIDNGTILEIGAGNELFYMNTSNRRTTLVTPTPTPIMITEPSAIPTPEIVSTVVPTPDITSEKRFVVITTPTPTPVNRNVDVSAKVKNPIQLDSQSTFNVYVKTNDEPLHDAVIRFNVSYMNKDHEWQGLGYIPLDSGKVLSLPAHSQTTRDIGPVTITRNGIILPDGTIFNFHIWATVYKFKIDLISDKDGKIVGSTELNNVQVVQKDSEGLISFDW